MTEPCDQPTDQSTVSLLLVEDDDLAAKRLSEMLTRPEGTRFEISRVPSVDEALVKLQNESYDVMLIDLSVHESYGLDSLLRARVATLSVPIVILTYQRDEEVAMKAARAGAQDYLTKGEVTPELISRTLLHAIERHRMLRELNEAKQRQRFLATHDSLTELPNRYSFMAQLSAALADAQRCESELAVMFLDLDGFKAVNDNLGHAVGDELLSDVARRLQTMIRKSDTVARVGGDEFLICIRNIAETPAPALIAEKIREEIEKPYHLAGCECWISASIGISSFPRDGDEADLLIRRADTAMYDVKSSGKNRVQVFDNYMNDKAAERFDLVNGLRDAIHDGQLVLAFQPQIQVATEEIVGLETLVRWNHPTRGLVSPSEFIQVAEETGLMVPLGEWVLHQACISAAKWTDLSSARVAVNISGRQLEQANFPERVAAILEETGLPATRLEIELTESLAASESALRAIDKLREMGVRAAIDDFGTGYSSLTLLKRMNVDMLKIDQSFVRGAAQTDPDAVILEAIINIAQGLGIEVIAEGVETLEEMDSVQVRGCTLMQGYLFAKPIPSEDLEATVVPEDALWRLPITRPEAWSPPAIEELIEIEEVSSENADTDTAPAPQDDYSEDDADMFPVLRDLPENMDSDDSSGSSDS
jgi:diguanylate cyclase (GGDEF)-like protein